MAQAVRRLGGEVVLVDMADHVLANEPAPLGEALGEVLRARRHRAGARRRARPGARARRATTSSSTSTTAAELRGDRLLVATGRRPRVDGIGLETVGIEADPHGIPVDAHLRAGDGLWAHRRRHRHLAVDDDRQVPGRHRRREHPGRATAKRNYEALPRVVFTDPQAAAVGAHRGARSAASAPVSGVAKTATYTRAYAESNGFLTLLSDGERLTGAYALGPEAGEWLQQATLAIRAHVPLDVLRDTIQPFPTFSEIYADALKALRTEIAAADR